ncbi:MAG: hypothetical protein BK997_02625 [Candidatus Micrarchaeum sp. ARMAN-1]|jgi:hypothetical protein|nr:MAG: hypothetical protein BK997_02625 [Candidatus Micrarchaeum sp. ARMAN-1]
MNLYDNKRGAGLGLYLMCIGYIVIIPSLAIILFGPYGYPIAALSSAMFFAYYIAKLKIQGLTSKIQNWVSFFGLASLITLKRMNNVPTAKALSDSVGIFEYNPNDVSVAVKDLPLAMRLVGFNGAISAIAAKPQRSKYYNHMPIMKSIAEKSGSGFDAIGSISAVMDSSIQNLENAFSAHNGRSNRNSTVLMLFSTVLPSFALFGIVGYSILSGGASFLPEAFAIFVVSAPIAYLIISKITSAVSNAII